MRKLYLGILAAVLLPAGLAAQKVPPVKSAPTRAADVKVQQAQAQAIAVQSVRAELQKGTFLHTWPILSGKSIDAAGLKTDGALFNPTGGKDGTPIWVVGVSAPNGKGHVRVLVNAASGAVADVAQSSFQWGVAPAYWQQGLNSPPPAKTNSPPPARSN